MIGEDVGGIAVHLGAGVATLSVEAPLPSSLPERASLMRPCMKPIKPLLSINQK
jgi:hypothetical protein